MEGYSLADIKAAVGEGEGFGGNGAWWIIILFLFLFGNGRFAGGTTPDIQQGFNTQEITRKLDGINYGMCDGFYAQNTTMLNGFAGITAAVDNARFASQQCCCETNRNIDSVRYDAQKNAWDLAAAIHAEGEQTRAMIQANEIQNLRDKVNDLQLDKSQCAQNEYLISRLRPCPTPAYLTCSPYASNPCGLGC